MSDKESTSDTTGAFVSTKLSDGVESTDGTTRDLEKEIT